MASILLKVTFITACLCWSTCLSQNQEQLLLIVVREAAEGIKAVSKKITDLDDKFTTKFGELDDKFGEMQGELQLLQHLDDKFTTKFGELDDKIIAKFGELDDKFTTKFGEVQGELQLLQRQMVELQESSQSDNLLNMFVEILKLERDLQKDIWNNQTCTIQHITELQANFSTEFQKMEASMEECSSVDQLSNLTMLLAKDECAEGSHGCSPLAVCKDTILSYKCICLPGYTGDGFSCEDDDECSTGDSSCHNDAECNNIQGNYTCACNPGFSGDGFSCEDDDECSTGANSCHNDAVCSNIQGNYTCACNSGFSGDGFNCEGTCLSPSHFMPSLGCITVVSEVMTWEDARQNCIKQGGRLLQGITNYDELQQLHRHFRPVLSIRSPKYHAWIGIKGGNWIEGGDPCISDPTPSSSLWNSGQPDDGDAACGFAHLDPTPTLYDRCCDHRFYSLCQRK